MVVNNGFHIYFADIVIHFGVMNIIRRYSLTVKFRLASQLLAYLLNHGLVTEATFAVDHVLVGKDHNHVIDSEATLAIDHVPVAEDHNHSTKLILLPYHKLPKNVPYSHMYLVEHVPCHFCIQSRSSSRIPGSIFSLEKPVIADLENFE